MMILTLRRASRQAPRVKLGFGILAGVLATLAAAQATASQSGSQPIANQGDAP